VTASTLLLSMLFALCAASFGCGSADTSPTTPSPSPRPSPPPITGSLQGVVRDFDTNAPIARATVEIGPTFGDARIPMTTTDANGAYRIELTPREFYVSAFRGDPTPGGRGFDFDYLPATVYDQRVGAGDTVTVDLSLKTRLLSTSWTLTGLLVDRFSHPIATAKIYVHDPADNLYLTGQPDAKLYGGATTDQTGHFTMTSRSRVEIPTIRVSAYWGTITGPVAEKDVPCCTGDVFLASPLLPENR